MKVNWKRVVFLAVLFGLIYTWPTEGQTLKVTPKVCLAPCEVHLELRIEPKAENRYWSISYPLGESGGPLDENSEYVHPVCLSNPRPCYRTLPEGTYLFVGCVQKAEGGKIVPHCVSQEVVVEGHHGSELSVSSVRGSPPHQQTHLQWQVRR